MLEKFYTDKFDDCAALEDDNTIITYRDLKRLISSAGYAVKDKKQNIAILENNSFNFVIKFFAALFSGKNIYLPSDEGKLKQLGIDYELFSETDFKPAAGSVKLPEIDENKPAVNFFTSGSSAGAKIIKKSFYNLRKEAQEAAQELFPDGLTPDTRFVSSAAMQHLFGMTFYLLLPLHSGLKIYTPPVLYPDNINFKNAVFVSTPSFLKTIEKNEITFKTAPEYIISSGSKLDEKVFNYLLKQTKLIEIYGSTETGVIAHKETAEKPFRVFNNVEIIQEEETALVISPYAYGGSASINDKIELEGGNLTIQSRTDRILKIYDKRINAEEIENCLNENDLVSDSFIFENAEKPAVLCALSKTGQEFLIKNGIFELTKELKAFLNSRSAIMPQRWKYIDELPRTNRGKINKELINHIFDVNLSLPVILNRKYAPERAEYEIFFYSACSFFEGHFPGFKILAGVVQLYFAAEAANARFNLNTGRGQIRRIKFSSIIKAGDIVKLSLVKTEKTLEFKYFDREKIYSSGIFALDNVFEDVCGCL